MKAPLTIKFKKLNPNAVVPRFTRIDDAAMDVTSTDSAVISPGCIRTLSTGIAAELPPGHWVKLEQRSGLAKHGLAVLGGVIDGNYRGEWKVMLLNTGPTTVLVKAGERIAQAALHYRPEVVVQEVQELTETGRGDAGFGSSGK
jgi:dUTP pyrophosphatase